jgi:hypothetical protein
MAMVRKISLLFIIAMAISSCSKVNPGDCFKSNGPVTSEEREVSSFTYLELKDNVDVYLTYAPEYRITVRAGKNIIPGIKTELSGYSLTISNENTCNWVRSYESPIEVYLSFPKIDSIHYMASGNLSSTNQLVGDSLNLDVLEGAGSINLWIHMKRSWFYLHYGTADLTVKGYSHINHLYSEGYGPADARDLNTVFSYVTNKSTNDCFVRSSLELEATIDNVGDVYYWGNPPTVSRSGSGSGSLIEQ